jgi:hypothetical protein
MATAQAAAVDKLKRDALTELANTEGNRTENLRDLIGQQGTALGSRRHGGDAGPCRADYRRSGNQRIGLRSAGVCRIFSWRVLLIFPRPTALSWCAR